MAITIDGKQKRIGLALSGGGFGAAAISLFYVSTKVLAPTANV